MFKGKTVVITGGSRGIGAAAAEKFAENGADVALIYAGNAERAGAVLRTCREFGVKAEAYQCDVSDFSAVSETFKSILSDFGTIDVLVNNAGITCDRLMPMMKEDEFDKVIDTNLKGAFNTIKQVYSVFMRKRSGKIVNISSVVGLTGNPGQVNYAASKAGIIGLTKSVAKELASRGVCCNAVAPGFIETDMTASLKDNPLKSQIPMGRTGKPEDVANVVLFLASPMADYITGEVVRVDGGLAM